jgi:hypothetical protein
VAKVAEERRPGRMNERRARVDCDVGPVRDIGFAHGAFLEETLAKRTERVRAGDRGEWERPRQPVRQVQVRARREQRQVRRRHEAHAHRA